MMEIRRLSQLHAREEAMQILSGDTARQNNLNDFKRAVVRRVRAWATAVCLVLREMTTDKDGFIGRSRAGLSVQHQHSLALALPPGQVCVWCKCPQLSVVIPVSSFDASARGRRLFLFCAVVWEKC